MSSPVDNKPNDTKPAEPSHGTYMAGASRAQLTHSDESKTMVEDVSTKDDLKVQRTRSRQEEHRIMDELSVLKAERQASMSRGKGTMRATRHSDAGHNGRRKEHELEVRSEPALQFKANYLLRNP